MRLFRGCDTRKCIRQGPSGFFRKEKTMKAESEGSKLAIVPAFNEEKRIGQVLKQIGEADKEVDVVVIDDGSTDKTGVTSKAAGATVLRLSSNMGYGVAVQTGYKYALEKGYGHVVQLDADGQHDPAYIPKVFEMIVSGDADIVIGSRFMEERVGREKAPVGYAVGKARRMGIRLFAFITSKLIRFEITDPTSGYRALNRRVLGFLANDFFPYDYPDADVIVLVHRAGFKIKEFSMVMRGREGGISMHSGLKPLYYIFKMFLSMLMTLLRKRPSLS
jgi:glycosyltransferase involved in cell wall biosynthesis